MAQTKKPKSEKKVTTVKQAKQSVRLGNSAVAMNRYITKIALACGFTLMTEERYQQLRSETPSVEFIRRPRVKKTES
ncbi:MAG: hypothetical protein R6V77_00080 [Candidatus Cloacimonadaceae bacterium]